MLRGRLGGCRSALRGEGAHLVGNLFGSSGDFKKLPAASQLGDGLQGNLCLTSPVSMSFSRTWTMVTPPRSDCEVVRCCH